MMNRNAQNPWPSRVIVTVAILASFAVPNLVSSAFWLHLADMMLINGIMAVGLNVILRTGQVSLAHAAFMAIGAFTSAQLTRTFGVPFLPALLAGAALAAAIAAITGRIILRLRGVYFLLFTFAFGEFLFLLSKQATTLTGGNTGIYGIQPPRLPFLPEALATPAAFYYLALCIFLLVLGGIAALYRTDFGREMNAVRESEALAEATGINPMHVQLVAFVIGCALAGLGGALFAHFARYISPFSFTFWESVQFLLMNIVGGTWMLAGPVIGAALITPLPEMLQDYLVWQQVLYGALLIIAIRLAPDGIAAAVRRVFSIAVVRLRTRKLRAPREQGT